MFRFPLDVKKIKIQIKLVAYYGIFAMLTIATVAWFAYMQAARALEVSVEDKLNTIAQLKRDSLNQWVDEQQRLTIFLSNLPELRSLSGEMLDQNISSDRQHNARQKLTDLVLLIVQRTSDFSDIEILDLNGEILVSAIQGNVGFSQAGQPYFIQGQTKTFVQNFYRSDILDGTVITVSTPLFDSGQRRVGVFAVHINMRRADRIVRENRTLNDPIQSYIFTKDNRILTNDPLVQNQSVPYHSIGIDNALLESSGTGTYINHNGLQVIGTFLWMEEQDVALVVEVDRAFALAPARALAINIILFGIGISFGLILIIIPLARQIAHPLQELTETALRIESGELDAVAPILSSDEIGILARTFNNMTEKLRQTLAELQNELVEREDLIQKLEVTNAETEALRESLTTIVGTLEFSEVIQHILDQVRRVVPYDSASVWKVKGNLQIFIGGRNLPPEVTSNISYLTDETNSARPILTGDVPYILQNDVQTALPEFLVPPHNYINSWLAVPLKVKGRIIGLIALDGMKKNQFTGRHVELAVTYADQVAIALENSLLFADLQQQLSLRKNLIDELESKNAELERFTYTVSHDLKSPLVTINGFLGYLERDARSGNMERLHKDIQRIQEAVNKMRRLLGELLELSRIGRLVNAPEMVPFADLAKDALDTVHGQLAERDIKVIVQPGLPVVYGDRQRLTEVLQNLIDNAAKFMGNQPSPQVEIGQRGDEADAECGGPVFFVRDNGIGIPEAQHERIFGLFNKLDATSDGTGIGLAIVKRIVEVHGGRIWVESEGAGRGSVFYFTLPITDRK
jgi:signal transduction histidine kinase